MPSVTWLASYPMRDNHWIRFLLASYLVDAPITSLDSLDSELPEQAILLRRGMMIPLNESGQTVVETHFLPEADVMRRYGDVTEKIIYVTLDPRTSMLKLMEGLRVSAAKRTEFVKDFIEHRGLSLFVENGNGTWPQSVRQWTHPAAARQYFPHAEVLTVRYEDLIDDPATALGRTAGFLGQASVSGERVGRAVKNGSLEAFDAVKRAERANGGPGPHDSQRGPLVSEMSWAALDPEADTAYKQWLREDEEFRLIVKDLGYEP
ncbi:MAG: sulfotransferase domain-containing protein [Trebonia sp.]